MHWQWLLVIAVTSDLLDYLGGALPLIGDILDLVTTGIMLRLLGPLGLTGVLELLPGVDFLPVYTLTVLLYLARERRRRGTLDGLEVSLWR